MRPGTVGADMGGRRRNFAMLVAPVAAAACLAGGVSGTAAAANASKRLVVYAVAVRAQFMNHADDRIRGMSANPFTPEQQALVIVTNGTEKKNGPFPGDDVLYTFDLHRDATLATSAGHALFTCYFTFVKRATCEAYFELKDGVLLASGVIAFGSSRFTLSVIGGTRAYLGAKGQVVAAPLAGKGKQAQRLDFRLLSR